MKAKELDICIPFYNTDINDFKTTIKSIITQKNKNFNLILLNDGSDVEELDEYVNQLLEKDYGFEIIYKKNKKNHGQCYNRIKILEYTKSPYIWYFDSDDVMYENATEIIIKNIKNNIFKPNTKPDIIEFTFDFYNNGDKNLVKYDFDFNNRFIGYFENNENEDKTVFNQLIDRNHMKTLWCKVFKRDLLLDALCANENEMLKYYEDKKVFMGEDSFFSYIIYMNAKNYLSTTFKIMRYNQTLKRHDKFYDDKMNKFIANTNFIYSYYYLSNYGEEKLKDSDDSIKYFRNILAQLLDQFRLMIYDFLNDPDYVDLKEEIETYFNTNYSQYCDMKLENGNLISTLEEDDEEE